jgi:hypothetical protein
MQPLTMQPLLLSHLVLLLVLSVPCACFPYLQFVLFAIRALVHCNGLTMQPSRPQQPHKDLLEISLREKVDGTDEYTLHLL